MYACTYLHVFKWLARPMRQLVASLSESELLGLVVPQFESRLQLLAPSLRPRAEDFLRILEGQPQRFDRQHGDSVGWVPRLLVWIEGNQWTTMAPPF